MWVDLNELGDPPPAEVKFLWGDKTNGLLQESSFMLLHSAEKQGKSMFMLNLAIAAARGDAEFLGFKIREGGFRTLILQCEVHMRAIWERFEEMKKNGALTYEQNKRINVNGYRAVTLSNPKSFTWFRRKIALWKPDLVVIDPLAHMLTEDENSNVAVGRGLAPLLQLRDDPGCSVAVVHHDSKASESHSARPAQQRSRGANRLTADPDSIISLTPTKRSGGPCSRMSCMPRYGRTMPPLRIRLNEDTFWFERYSAESEHADSIVALIAEAGGQMTEDALVNAAEAMWGLADSQGRHRTALGRIEKVVLEGLILKFEPEDGVYYKLPPERKSRKDDE